MSKVRNVKPSKKAHLSCSATGYPLPTVVWRSPGGKRLDRSFLDQAQDIYGEIYSIQENIIARNTRKYAFERNHGYNFVRSFLQLLSTGI